MVFCRIENEDCEYLEGVLCIVNCVSCIVYRVFSGAREQERRPWLGGVLYPRSSDAINDRQRHALRSKKAVWSSCYQKLRQKQHNTEYICRGMLECLNPSVLVDFQLGTERLHNSDS
jgi:hypothetical protein